MTALFRNLKHYRDVTRGFQDSLDAPWPAAEDKIHRDPERLRMQNFLDLMDQAVFRRPRSPYYSLFNWAGCTFGDLQKEVSSLGLDAALKKLLQAGVFISHREFKSRQALKRGSRQFSLTDDAFLNPLAKGWLPVRSGGSSGTPTDVAPSTLHLLERARYLALLCQEFSLQDYLHVAVRPILPGAAGLMDTQQLALLGCKIDRWFSPSGAGADSFHYRWLTRYIIALERRHHISVPYPVFLKSNDYVPVVQWIAKRKKKGFKISIGCFISHALRIATTARDCGCDISGSIFLAGGEALTPAKRQVIEAAGARIFPRYHISEAGVAGLPCLQMNQDNCVHALDDKLVAVSGTLEPPDSSPVDHVLFFSSISPSAPFLLVNVDMGDTGVIEDASCDCRFSAAGFRHQIRSIQSYAKLTSQGMTLESSDLSELLEFALPRQFGGTSHDYQLVEMEGLSQTQLLIRVHPRIQNIDAETVLRFFMAQIRNLHGGALASRTWAASRGIQVERAIPQATSSGKYSSILLLRERQHDSS